MKGGSKLFIFAGVGLAVVAVLLGIMSFSGGGKTDAQSQPKTTKVTVVEVKLAVPAHQIFTVDDVLEKQVNSDTVDPDAQLTSAEVIGQAYKIPVIPGQTLLRAQMEQPGLQNDIADGRRAISLPVADWQMMAGLVQEGDYIDIVYEPRLNLVRQLFSAGVMIPEDTIYSIQSPPVFGPDDTQGTLTPPTGDPGSQFWIRDGTGDQGEMEPVAKVMLQDVRVLRVVRPGEQYNGDGTKVDQGDSGTSGGNTPVNGMLIIELTPQQAEVLRSWRTSR